jgi:hypothetical protein
MPGVLVVEVVAEVVATKVVVEVVVKVVVEVELGRRVQWSSGRHMCRHWSRRSSDC